MSQATLARVRVPVVLSTLPGNSDSCPKNREVNHQSHATRARVRWSAGATSCPSLLGPCFEGPRGRPALPGDARSAPITREVDQHSRATRTLLRVHSVSTSSPGQHELCSEAPRRPPAPPGDSSLCTMSCGVDHLSQATLARVRVPAVSSTPPGVSDSCPKTLEVEHQSRATRAWVRCSTGLTSCHSLLGP